MVKFLFRYFPIFLCAGCLSEYPLPEEVSNVHYLVVDAHLDPILGSCKVTLSLTKGLDESSAPPAPSNASIVLEDDLGGSVSLISLGEGLYAIENISVAVYAKYRIRISIPGKESVFISEWVRPIITPEIDRLEWATEGDALALRLYTHDLTGSSRYYKWKYSETWEHESAYKAIVELKNGGVISRTDNIYTCWRTISQNNILSHTTIQLQEDVVSGYPVITIPNGSEKLFIRYSAEIMQYAITQSEFEYLEVLKKNTQNLGTFFDPMPSRILGNFNSTNSDEPILGYFNASSVSKKRIFITKQELPTEFKHSANYDSCNLTILLNENIPTYKGSELLVTLYNVGDFTLGYFKSSPQCVDCRLAGGVNQKPSFW